MTWLARPSRRGVLRGGLGAGVALAAGAGAGAGAGACSRAGAAVAGGQGRGGLVDVHHHFLPPAYLKGREDLVAGHSKGFTQVLEWTPERSLAEMDGAGTRTAVLSFTDQIWFGKADETRGLARMANDYAARLAAEHPGRFAFFVTLPMPDIDGALEELRHGLDTLGAARGAMGVALVSNYEGQYLGDERFAPLLAELDRRGAVVYVHPVGAPCCPNPVPQISPAFVELPVDTTRTITSLLWSGALTRHPRIRWIFSHGGGTIPFLADRIAHWAVARPAVAEAMRGGPMGELARLSFDSASVTNAPALAAIGKLVPYSQLLFGTDYPYVHTAEQRDELRANIPDTAALAQIEHGNAERMMPALAA